MQELRSESGRQFDPLVVEALAELLANPAPEASDDIDDLTVLASSFGS